MAVAVSVAEILNFGIGVVVADASVSLKRRIGRWRFRRSVRQRACQRVEAHRDSFERYDRIEPLATSKDFAKVVVAKVMGARREVKAAELAPMLRGIPVDDARLLAEIFAAAWADRVLEVADDVDRRQLQQLSDIRARLARLTTQLGEQLAGVAKDTSEILRRLEPKEVGIVVRHFGARPRRYVGYVDDSVPRGTHGGCRFAGPPIGRGGGFTGRSPPWPQRPEHARGPRQPCQLVPVGWACR